MKIDQTITLLLSNFLFFQFNDFASHDLTVFKYTKIAFLLVLAK